MTQVTKRVFSELNSNKKNAEIYRLDNGRVWVDITDLGATIVSIFSPDKNGEQADIILGYDTAMEYQKNSGYFGATVGRCANRIAKGQFELNKKNYTLFKNDGENHLHGGNVGFDKKLWDCEIVENGVAMSISSPDGEEGYPGTLSLKVTFTLSQDDTLTQIYEAISDKDTVFNPTNHAYFNLEGHGNGKVLEHSITINANRFTRVAKGAIPTGELPEVKGTSFDFTTPHRIGERLSLSDPDQAVCGGYDHNFVLAQTKGAIKVAAVLEAPTSGRVLTVSTDMPGIQLYIGNLIDPVKGKCGSDYAKHSGLCLETQFFPDSPNQPSFPSCVLKANTPFTSSTLWSFSTKK